ncbi:hypothetical protein ACQ4M3_01335 [Leptolyngbya sp. AN03gr2]|uniref:hypothetical protein n=1 Tax=unclassified Leptolyngbya TaxID=2650499 RepID=UPI003D3237A3
MKFYDTAAGKESTTWFFSAVTAVVVNDETEKAELQAMGFEFLRVCMDATVGDIG